MLKRREMLKIMGVGSLALALPWPMLAQGSSLRTQRLTDQLTLISGAGTNVVVAEGPDSVLVVDGGLRQNAQALLDEINELTGGKPITTLFNSNWRPEHRGLNHLLADTDTRIIAHENTRLWQSVDVYVEWEDTHYQPVPKAARANSTFYKKDSLKLGGQTVEYGFLPRGHTDGDLYVYFREADVLVVSDVLGVNDYPIMDYVTGGWIGGMQDSTALLLELAGEDTRIIAANGSVQSRADLQAQAEMLDKAYEKVADAFRSGMSLEDFKQTNPAADFAERWGNDPDVFLTQLYRGTWYHIPGRAVRGVI